MSAYSEFFEHCPRYHHGLSKWEHLAQVGGPLFYPLLKHQKNGIRTYGLRFHFGGWIFENDRSVRRRMRRMWRKQARRQGKAWIEEQEEQAA